jgi:hypothetical protein
MRATPCAVTFLVVLMLASGFTAGDSGRAGPALSVSISAPLNNSVVRGVVNITGTASGPDMPNTTVSVSLDGGQWFGARGTNSWFKGWDTSGAENGPHTIRARAADGSGEAMEEITVTVDNPPPVVSRIINATPERQNITERLGANITFAVTLAGDPSMTGVVWSLNNNREIGNSASNHSWDFNTPGNYTVEARYLRGELTVDLRIWNITILPPNRGPVFGKANFPPGNYSASRDEKADFNILATDPDGTELLYQWFYDDEPLNITGPNATIKFNKGGDHKLRAVISDGETNITIRWNFAVDDPAPVGVMDSMPCIIYIVVGLMLGVVYGLRAKARARPA